MPEKKIEYMCQKCGHKWTPRKPGKPYQCPKRGCGTPYWETGEGKRDARAEQLKRAKERQQAILSDDSFLDKVVEKAVDKILESKQPPEPETRDVPFVPGVSCGPPGGLSDDIGSVKNFTVTDPEAIKLMTPGAWVACADGDSMQDKTLPNSINDGDYLLMVPIAEWKKDILPGMAILSYVYLRDGSEGRTLKEYQGKKLRARNPKFTGINFSDGGDVVEAHAVAVCVYRLGQSFVDKK